MSRIQEIVHPGTLAEAQAVLREKGDLAAVLAGGTSLSLRLPASVDTLVDLSRISLKGIEDRGDSTAILACTTIRELADSQVFQNSYGGLLSRAARRVASTPLRNLITVGGNAFQVYRWSDLPGVLLALGANFVIQGEATRTIPAAEFYAAHPRTQLKPGELLTEIRVPKPVGRAEGRFVKVSKTAFDYAALSVTAVAWFSGATVKDCAVTVGSVKPLPQRIPQAEEEIRGKEPTREDIVRAAARAAGAVEPAQDYRYSAEYRQHLVKVWVKRCLHALVG